MAHLIEYKIKENIEVEKLTGLATQFLQKVQNDFFEAVRNNPIKFDDIDGLLGRKEIFLQEENDGFRIGKAKNRKINCDQDVSPGWELTEVLNQIRQFYIIVETLQKLYELNDSLLIENLSPSQQPGIDILGKYGNKRFGVEVYGGVDIYNNEKFQSDCWRLIHEEGITDKYFACFSDAFPMKDLNKEFSYTLKNTNKNPTSLMYKWEAEIVDTNSDKKKHVGPDVLLLKINKSK